MNKSCLNCKYSDQSENSEPCICCGIGPEVYNRWEPKEEDDK